MRVDPRAGRRYRTRATVRERFKDYTLIECRALPGKPGQIAAHLRHARHPLVGDPDRGGKLFLSKLKRDYHLNKHREERPLIGRTALHLEAVTFPHPTTGEKMTVEAPLPKDFSVALKYLRRFGR
jgi:23S rRNA-/tRNA-specific pseudouridylate synthase